MALIYKYANTLCTYRITGSQLKRYMEWSALYYNTFMEGDLTISFNPERYSYDYDLFDGVCYEINLSKEPGNRIENLTWPDGAPVLDTDVFKIAVSSYRAGTQFSVPGEIFENGDLPVAVDTDIMGTAGNIREMIGEYIARVKKGVISSDDRQNWRITGINWDEDLHQKAVSLLAEGRIALPEAVSGSIFNTKPIRVEDVGLALN